jgi:hypothetical protein
MEHSSRNTDRHMFRESRRNTRQLLADTGTLNRIVLGTFLYFSKYQGTQVGVRYVPGEQGEHSPVTC